MSNEIGDFNSMLHLELTLSLHIYIFINVKTNQKQTFKVKRIQKVIFSLIILF